MAETITRRGTSRSADELAEMIEIARLHFEQGLTQNGIADKLHIPQSRVFRRLKQAKDRGIVKTTVSLPPIQTLQTELLAVLRRRKKVRDVKIVPRGAEGNKGINADNLGTEGAEFLEKIAVQHPSDELTIAMACGKTLLVLLTRFAARLEQTLIVLKELRKKTIVLYPLNLYWGSIFDGNASPSPSALVIHTAVLLSRLGIKVRAHTPLPRLSFSHDVESDLDGEGTKYIQDVEQADIFLLGIGTGDSHYRNVVKDLHLEDILQRDDIAGELNYQPFLTDGTFLSLEGFPGVQAKRLQELAKTEKKIIAVAGGAEKANAVSSILKKNPPFNILITDEDIAEKNRW